MNVVGEFRIEGRGFALVTDEEFSPAAIAAAKKHRKLHVALGDCDIVFSIIAAEAILKCGGQEFLGFIVSDVSDESDRSAVLGRAVNLC